MKKITKDVALVPRLPTDVWPGYIHNSSPECYRPINVLALTVRRDRNTRTFRRHLLPSTSDKPRSSLPYA